MFFTDLAGEGPSDPDLEVLSPSRMFCWLVGHLLNYCIYNSSEVEKSAFKFNPSIAFEFDVSFKLCSDFDSRLILFFSCLARQK